jgi:hypothetical protein
MSPNPSDRCDNRNPIKGETGSALTQSMRKKSAAAQMPGPAETEAIPDAGRKLPMLKKGLSCFPTVSEPHQKPI